MNKNFLWSCIVGGVLCGFASCTSTSTNNPADVNIIPLPNEIQLAHGHFSLKEGMTISFSDKGIQPAAEYLTSLLTRSTGFVLNTKESDQGNIRLILTQEAEEKEGSYTVNVKADYVEIAAASYGGIISGIETVRQLLSPDIESTESIQGKTWTIPAVNIKDAPRFEWRGLMLDVSRHFYTKEEVKELLDLMALYKMNKFHWHLTDDQGWRVEIKKYPDLTEKGAWRAFNAQDRECMRRAIAENNPDYQIPEEKLRIVQGDTLYGGYYTQEDIKEVVQYASVRGTCLLRSATTAVFLVSRQPVGERPSPLLFVRVKRALWSFAKTCMPKSSRCSLINMYISEATRWKNPTGRSALIAKRGLRTTD